MLEWNAIAVTTMGTQSPFAQARFAAITQLAVFEAVNAVTGDFQPYLETRTAEAARKPHARIRSTSRKEGLPKVRSMGGTGGGGVEGEMEYRQAYAIAPAPPSDGSEIVIEVREISWERLGHGTRKVLSVDSGPWRFTIRR